MKAQERPMAAARELIDTGAEQPCSTGLVLQGFCHAAHARSLKSPGGCTWIGPEPYRHSDQATMLDTFYPSEQSN